MYICSAKKDWVGRNLISILVSNFSGFSKKYFLKAIELRLISINESRASPGQVIKDGDILRHLVLRHEPHAFFWTRHTTTAVSTAKARMHTFSNLLSRTPINPASTEATIPSTISDSPGTSSSLPNASIAPLRANPIPWPADTRVGSIGVKWFCHDRVLVADKPPGIPVHPCGAYYHHTVTQLLAAGRWYSTDRDSTGALEGHCSGLLRRRARLLRGRVHALHRLDRLVGGVLLLCTDANTARDMAKDITAGDCDKIYVARVSGKFPHRVACSQPIRKRPVTADAANGSSEPLRECHADGKPARTTFELLRYLQVCATGRQDMRRMFSLHACQCPHTNMPTCLTG